MYGGQNLVPFGQQVQYSDMWILTIPSFTWIPVDTSSQSTPYARAGHTCNIWDGQIVVVGGYIGQDITCEAPGIYVFNASSLEWVNSFTALSKDASSNPFSQQLVQKGAGKNNGLQGSYGYSVPKAVYDVVGGDYAGGATVTAPVASASAGPLATGKPVTYTATVSNGATIIATATSPASGHSNSEPNVGAIVAGTIAGCLFLLTLYLAFCAFLYRKQLQLYKRHVAASSEVANARYSDSPSGLFLGNKSSTEGASSGHTHTGTPVGGTRHSGSVNGTTGTTGGQAANAADSDENLLGGMEPNYWGVLLHPRRSLRVINR
jgi:hypothetical protein